MKVRDFWWCDGSKTNNWAAVCGGGVGVAVLHYGTEDEIEEILPVLNKGMEHYIDAFNDDGCCLEGYSYWNYGFGYYLLYAMAVRDYSKGKIDMLKSEKVKRIALFPQRIRMGKSKIVSFSDGGNSFTFSPGMFSLLKKLYGNEVVYPPVEYATLQGNVYSIKELLWFDTEYKEYENKFLTTFFNSSQWYIKQGKKYSFAAKGGNNDEPHNHNDIGSFMIVTDDDIPLVDLGCAIYRKETFDPRYRYTLLNNGSQGHSVPIINGEYQQDGVEYKAENVKAGEDFFELDIEGAYEKGLCKRINRRFELQEKSVILRDTFEYSDKTEDITERFVSLVKPEIYQDYVDLKTAKIVYDNEKYSVSISEDSYRNHADTEDVTVYLIDFKGINKGEFKVEILLSDKVV